MILNPENLEYGPDDKYEPKVGYFGIGKYWDAYPEILSKVKKQDLLPHTLRLGWSSGCSRPLFCIEVYGLLWMAKRYSDCNRMFSRVFSEATSINHILANMLIAPSVRLPGEKEVGLHEPTSVPKSHLGLIFPMSGLYGYAIPRLLLLRMNADHSWNYSQRAEQIQTTNIRKAYSLNELLAGITKDISLEVDLEREKILSHVLPQGILEEENCHTIYDQFARTLIRYAPELCKFYGELTPSQRKELEIADIPALR